MDYSKGINSTLENVKVMWAKLVKPDTFMGSSKWSIDILLDPKLAEELKKRGFNVKKTKDGEDYVRATKKTMTSKGPQEPPVVVGKDGITPIDGSSIGNGSLCNIKVFCRKYPAGTYVSMFINAIQVVDLVTFSEAPFAPIKSASDTTSTPLKSYSEDTYAPAE